MKAGHHADLADAEASLSIANLSLSRLNERFSNELLYLRRANAMAYTPGHKRLNKGSDEVGRGE